jgi:phosphate acetyltransferase
MSGIVETLLERLAGQRLPVVFPELSDPRVQAAAERLSARDAVEPLAVPPAPSAAHVSAVMAARDLKEPLARRMLARPLFRAAAMVATGEAVTMVAGAEAATKKVIEAASIAIGTTGPVSSFFLMSFPPSGDAPARDLIFADCAVNVAPDAATLAAIAKGAADAGRALLGDANVALLSFSTGKSGAGSSVDLVAEVAEATGFPGPLQADAALNPVIAAKKGLGAGDANVLVFPSLDAGNIAYKLAQELGGAQAVGPVLQGFRRPVCDLSRGATAEDITAATLVTLALAIDGAPVGSQP